MQTELDVYSPETLLAIQEACDAAWAALRKNDPFRNFANDGDLRALLCEKLFALAGESFADWRWKAWPRNACSCDRSPAVLVVVTARRVTSPFLDHRLGQACRADRWTRSASRERPPSSCPVSVSSSRDCFSAGLWPRRPPVVKFVALRFEAEAQRARRHNDSV